MCTLTYIPPFNNQDDFLITDNRDESVNRPAIFPKVYAEYQTRLFYPRDIKAGGTWFGIAQQNRAMALLNGAFKRHQRNPYYKKSRGVVVKELLAMSDIKQGIRAYDFSGIEAFYGVMFLWKKEMEIIEIIWDGEQLFQNKKEADKPHIWSSAMTFSPEEHQKKVTLFEAFLNENKDSECLPELLWDFHENRDPQAHMILDYEKLKTTSISQFHYTPEADFFRYKDLLTQEVQEDEIIW